jgi:hypothetical protein
VEDRHVAFFAEILGFEAVCCTFEPVNNPVCGIRPSHLLAPGKQKSPIRSNFAYPVNNSFLLRQATNNHS